MDTLDFIALAGITTTTFTPSHFVSPKLVGRWVLYPGAPVKTTFGMYKRPTDTQIKNTEELLGWGWEDVE